MNITTPLLVVLMILLNSNIDAQNVGIGTTTPVNKLSVHGKVDIRDSLGIGTNDPEGALHVKAPGTIEMADQAQLMHNLSRASGLSFWQSFTAGITGNLTRMELLANCPDYTQPAPATIKIYSGEGTGGALLSTSNVTLYLIGSSFNPEFQLLPISTPTPVVAGNVYTMEITVSYDLRDWMFYIATNPYPAGRSNFSAFHDLAFKTYTSVSGMIDALMVKNGNIGLGTANPAQRLDVVGGIRAANLQLTNGAGENYVLRSDPNGNASWVNASTVIPSPTETDPQVGLISINTIPVWNGSSLNNSTIYQDDNTDYIGIGTLTPTERLDVNGGVRALSVRLTTGATAGYILRSDAAGNATWVNPSTVVAAETDPQVGALTNDMIPKWNGTSLVNGIVFDNGSRVGIGTASPASTLSVSGNANFTGNVGIGVSSASSLLHLQSPNVDNTPRGDIIMARYWGSNADTRASSIFHYNNSNTNSDNLAFGVSGNGGSSFGQPNLLSQIKMLIQANGHVGIGTTAPVTTLDVEGGIRTKYCGSVIFDVVGGGIVRTLTITIPALPAGWDLSNTFLAVTNVDGQMGTIRQATIKSPTSIDIKYAQDTNGPVRFNWIIFKM